MILDEEYRIGHLEWADLEQEELGKLIKFAALVQNISLSNVLGSVGD